MTAAVIREIQRAQAMFPRRKTPAERIVRRLQGCRQDVDGQRTAHLFVAALPRSPRAEAAIAATGSEWAGPVTDYELRDVLVAELAQRFALTERFAVAWERARAALADFRQVPDFDASDEDPWSLASWLEDAESVVARALVARPAVTVVPPAGAQVIGRG